MAENADFGIFGKNACKNTCSYDNAFKNIGGFSLKDYLFGSKRISYESEDPGFKAFLEQIENSEEE